MAETFGLNLKSYRTIIGATIHFLTTPHQLLGSPWQHTVARITLTKYCKTGFAVKCSKQACTLYSINTLTTSTVQHTEHSHQILLTLLHFYTLTRKHAFYLLMTFPLSRFSSLYHILLQHLSDNVNCKVTCSVLVTMLP